MSRLAQLSGVIIVLIGALAQILSDPRITKRFITNSLWALLIYAVYVGVGLTATLILLPQGPEAAAGTTLVMLGWIGLGGLGLVHMAPRLRDPPAFLAKFGAADITCLAAISAGLFMAANA